jgi:hypothetical protein
MTQIVKLTHVKTYTWMRKIKVCYICSSSCFMLVTMTLTGVTGYTTIIHMPMTLWQAIILTSVELYGP